MSKHDRPNDKFEGFKSNWEWSCGVEMLDVKGGIELGRHRHQDNSQNS